MENITIKFKLIEIKRIIAKHINKKYNIDAKIENIYFTPSPDILIVIYSNFEKEK